MKIYLLLLFVFVACSESEPIDPINHTMKGEFMLVRAVGLEPMHIGGPNLDDPIIIEYIPHTYEHPAFTGRLTSGIYWNFY